MQKKLIALAIASVFFGIAWAAPVVVARPAPVVPAPKPVAPAAKPAAKQAEPAPVPVVTPVVPVITSKGASCNEQRRKKGEC